MEKTQRLSMCQPSNKGLGSRLSAFARSRVGSVVCLIATVGLAWTLTEHLLVTTTPSLSQRVFWKSNDISNIDTVKKGDFIIFDQYLPEPKKETRSVIKRVACASGDTLSVQGDSYYCNGQYLGIAKHKSLLGNPLTPFVYNGTVPQGSVFAMGDHRDSYDSRYWGFKKLNAVNARAWAIF